MMTFLGRYLALMVLLAPVSFYQHIRPIWKDGRRASLGGLVFTNAAQCNNSSGANASLAQGQIVEEIIRVTPESSAGLDLPFIFNCEDGNFQVTWSGLIEVTDTIRIGNGTSVSITASTASAVVAASGEVGPSFAVSAGASLHMDGITVRGWTATNRSGTADALISGGGIYAWASNVTVTSCVFEDNFAGMWGGCIFGNYSTLVVRDTVFRRCRAGVIPEAGDEDVVARGGGIAGNYTEILIDGCLFESGYASDKGGGVHMANSSITVLNSTFFNNSAGSEFVDEEEPIGQGGDISFSDCLHGFDGHNAVGAFGANDTIFKGAFVAKKGGAIYIGGDRPESLFAELHRCVIDGAKTGKYHKDDPQGEGGAFSVANGVTLLVVDTTVKNTQAGKKGGAINLSSDDDENSFDLGASVILRNCTFEGCRANASTGGVAYLNEFTTISILGDDNRFLNNIAEENGGVLAATSDTRIIIEGGSFVKNTAAESGGVIWTKGRATILGGEFEDNEANAHGGVFMVGEFGFVAIDDGFFKSNYADEDGGVGYSSSDTGISIQGGEFIDNIAGNAGGGFALQDNTYFNISGGNFTRNEADYGGFLYKEGSGSTVCSNATITEHMGVDGGAVYALANAVVDWECDLVNNTALTGPAIYARQGASVTLRGVGLYDNTVSRGSIAFVVNSSLYTYQVLFNDSTEAEDLSAVQSDMHSTFVAVDTSFVGFKGQEVVFSEGTLFMDDCDFRGSSANVLLYAQKSERTTVRNARLGDRNYEGPRRTASLAGILPNVSGEISNVDLTCDTAEITSPCSEDSLCIDGDLGVYCECYVREYEGSQFPPTLVCTDGSMDVVMGSVEGLNERTLYPERPEGDIKLSVPSYGSGRRLSTSGGSGGVIWTSAPTTSSEGMAWTVFPSVGLLYPGESIILRVVGDPSDDDDGTFNTVFSVSVVRSHATEATTSKRVSVSYFHCDAGLFWPNDDADADATGSAVGAERQCELCTNGVKGDIEGVNCSEAGVSSSTLRIKEGYWRETLAAVFIHKCFNPEACRGGSSVQTVNDYCKEGYKGPYCGVCSSGFGQGVGNTCHACTAGFEAGMFTLVALAALVALLGALLIAVYLVGGGDAVSSTMSAARDSMYALRHRGSEIPSISNQGAASTHPEPRDDFNTSVRGDGTSSIENMTSKANDGSPPARSEGGANTRMTTAESKKAENKKKSTTALIGIYLSKLPLSKIKIVVVVWQISGAFADITNVPFPPLYEKFVNVISVFTLDLGWIFSAACLTPGIDFFDKLLMVTIGPVFLLCLLGVTFAIGRRRHVVASEVPVESFRAFFAKSSARAGGGSIRPTPSSSVISSRNAPPGEKTDDAYDFHDSSLSNDQQQHVPGAIQQMGRLGPRSGGASLRRTRQKMPQSSEEDRLWQLFARHTTMTLIILYLVYSQVSTVVFQTFQCEDLNEIDKRYLRADLRIECDTAEYKAYELYAGFMVILYPLGIPAAFLYFLVRHKSRINPEVGKEDSNDRVAAAKIQEEKLKQREMDPSISPTSFLWSQYIPSRYYYEVLECIRRLLLTGLLVFLGSDTAGQVAFGCMFAFISLLAFELLQPHVDRVDIQLYRTGCLVIFFSNFLALMIKAGVADPKSSGSVAYSVFLIGVNVLFFLSIWWDAVASVKALFSRKHAQGSLLGMDLVSEGLIDSTFPKKTKTNTTDSHGEGKMDVESVERAPTWNVT